MRRALQAANIAVSIGLCGCAFSPPVPNDTVFEPKIARAVLSELYCAVKFLRQRDPANPDAPLNPESANSEVFRADFFPYDEYWVGAIDMNLKTDFEAMVTPELTLLGPINSVSRLLPGRTAGTYNLAAGGGYDSTATSQRDNKFYVDINLLMQHWAPPTWEEARRNAAPNSKKQYVLSEPIDCERPNEGTYLDGTLGIKPWLRRSIQATQFGRFIAPDPNFPDPAHPNLHPTIQAVWPATNAPWSIPIAVQPYVAGHTPSARTTGSVPTLGGTFTFVIKGSAHLGPSIALDRVKGGGPTLLSSMRTETNYVAVTLTPSRVEATVPGPTTGAKKAPPAFTKDERRRPEVTTPLLPPRPVTRFVQTDVSLADALNRLDQALVRMQLNALNRQ